MENFKSTLIAEGKKGRNSADFKSIVEGSRPNNFKIEVHIEDF